jgi:hypothetical protein
MQTPRAKHMSNQNRVLQHEATFLRELRWVDAGCTGESKRGRESAVAQCNPRCPCFMVTRQFGPSVGSHIEQGRPAGPPPNLSTTRLPHRRIVSPRTSPPFRTTRIFANTHSRPFGSYRGRILSATPLRQTRIDAHPCHRRFRTRRLALDIPRPPPPAPHPQAL